MATELPDEIDCRLLADELGTVSGQISATRLARVRGIFRLSGNVNVGMESHRDKNNRVVVTGEITAPMEAKCQRCLEWMSLEIGVTMRVVAVPSVDDQKSWEIDCIVAPDWKLHVLELIEDEILLACPMIPAHEKVSCHPPPSRAVEPPKSRYKPFGHLAELIEKKDDDINAK